MMKKSVKFLSLLLSILMLLPFCVSCDNKEEQNNEPAYTAVFTLADLGTEVSFHTNEQNEAWNMKDLNLVAKKYSGDKELSRPLPVTLSWNYECDDPAAFTDYTVSLSENEDISDAVVYTTTETSLEIYNLKIGTQYFWNVVTNCEGVSYTSETSTFTTSSQGPRNLYVDGITNVRDLGGYVCENGGVVRQGLLIRCGRLNLTNASTLTIEITEAGQNVFANDFKIKTEVDLREVKNSENGKLKNSAVPGATLVQLPMVYDQGSIMTTNDAKIPDFFALLADEANYPIIFHCNIGTDRTGLLAYMVLTLCGVDYDTICRDYTFSNLGVINGTRRPSTLDGYEKILAGLKLPAGTSRADQMRAYLKKLGVTDEQIDSMIRIMREDPADL